MPRSPDLGAYANEAHRRLVDLQVEHINASLTRRTQIEAEQARLRDLRVAHGFSRLTDAQKAELDQLDEASRHHDRGATASSAPSAPLAPSAGSGGCW